VKRVRSHADVDIVRKHDIVVLEDVAAHIDARREERRLIHAVGDGHFIADGPSFDRRRAMQARLPPGV
jgi:hypothetical protein